jgi:c-di-GMP-binding flagellar brake protein YcgR
LLSFAFIYPFRCQLCARRFKTMQWGIRYSKKPVDRRENVRIQIGLPVTISSPHAKAKGMVKDLSVRGCRVKTEGQFPEGALLQLHVQVVDNAPSIEVDAAVVRSSHAGFIGMEFLRVRREEKDRLSQFVRSLLLATRQP